MRSGGSPRHCGYVAATVAFAAAAALVAAASGARPVLITGPRGANQTVALPTARQLQWQEMQLGAMITWNVQTACVPRGGIVPVSSQACQEGSKTAGELFLPTPEATAAWNPDQLDTDQWAEVAASFGAKYIVLVADHMAGFALWDTKLHNYSIAHTVRGGDVVRELLASCRKFRLKLGFFYSVHFNWWVGLDSFRLNAVSPLGGDTYRNLSRADFDALVQAQLNEVLDIWEEDRSAAGAIANDDGTGDVEAFEVWFDGGTGPFNDTVAAVVRNRTRLAGSGRQRGLCHSCFPFTQDDDVGASERGFGVRWMGNEEGQMPVPSWGAIPNDFQQQPFGGDPYGAIFSPPSTDTVLREHYWFWQPDTEVYVKSTSRLVSNYLTSVGRASNLILNIAPDATGAVPAVDVLRYKDMGAAVKCLSAHPLAASTGRLPMDTTTGTMPAVEFPAAPVTSGNVSLVLMEDQTQGQLIGNFTLECLLVNSSVTTNATATATAIASNSGADGAAAPSWQACPMGSLAGSIDAVPSAGVGHKRIYLLALPAAGSRNAGATQLIGVRVTVKSHFASPNASAVPTLRSLALYDWEPCA